MQTGVLCSATAGTSHISLVLPPSAAFGRAACGTAASSTSGAGWATAASLGTSWAALTSEMFNKSLKLSTWFPASKKWCWSLPLHSDLLPFIGFLTFTELILPSLLFNLTKYFNYVHIYMQRKGIYFHGSRSLGAGLRMLSTRDTYLW